MKIKSALLLAAGLGTRMGEVGEKLPKPLWPIFDMPIIQLEIEFLRQKGIEKIFINIHHKAEKIKQYFKNNPQDDVELIEESEILGVGGAIYNIHGRIKNEEILWVTTSDQFCFYRNENALNDACQLLESADVVLFGIYDREKPEHNEVVTKGSKVVGIRKGEAANLPYITHSGASLIKISSIEQLAGYQDYFDTIADYKKKEVKILDKNDFEYWDYGTANRYFSGMWKNLNNIIHDDKGEMEKFLLSCGAFDLKKVHYKQQTYGQTTSSNLINLSGVEVASTTSERCIVLEAKGEIKELRKEGIYWNDVYTSSGT